jgi:hypothetical protein
MIDIENFANITSYVAKISPSVNTLSGVLNNDIGFTSKLALFSLDSPLYKELIDSSLISDKAILLYGPVENTIIAINTTTLAENMFVLVNQKNIQLSAVSNLPSANTMIDKAELTSKVYIISISNGNILQELSIKENEYLTKMYKSFDEKGVTMLFTDFANWCAYRLVLDEKTDSKSLVNIYVILMSAFLILILIISVIYILQPREINTESTSSTAP